MKLRAFFFILLAWTVSGQAVDIKATRVEQGPKIDGSLSDPVWQTVPPFTAFRMAEPQPDQEPTERTELRILYDDANLYIGVICYDREPSRIAANSLAHDAGGGSNGDPHQQEESANDDLLRVLLDPFMDKRTAYIFFVNPRGARSEGLTSGGSSSLNWDGIWDARSRILENGWSAEFRIPFKTISFKSGLTAWGINVERLIARKQEVIRLSGSRRDSNFYNPMEAASLEGISGIRQGKGITFRPYGLLSARKDQLHPGGGWEWTVDGGFDLYKNFTPSLVGAFSYNMDFAETEADERRINLTRFPLFFPEKRMFFLEGSETFNFSSSASFQPFFSRNIGLYNGLPVPILFGLKLYGKISRTNLAVLDVQTEDISGLPGNNFLALRLTQDIFAESKVGLIVTNGSPDGARNTLAAVDFQYSTSKLAGDKNLMLAAWMAYNWNEQNDGSHVGFGFRADYPNDLWDIRSVYAYYGEALDPGLGFMMRRGIQTGFIRIGFQPRPTKGLLDRLVRQFFFSASGDFYWDLSGHLETSELSATLLNFTTESGEQLEFEVEAVHDVLHDDFEVADGVVLSPGAYDFTSWRLDVSSASHRPVVFSAGINFGEFYSGRYEDINGGVTLKFKGYVSLSLDVNFVRGRLPEGDFSENVYQLKADFFLSPDLGLMNYIQYDTISRLLGWSSRLRWRLSPGNEIALVYNKNWERRWDPTSRFFPVEERGVLKLSLSIRP